MRLSAAEESDELTPSENRFWTFSKVAPHAHRRRIGIGIFGMGLLHILKFAQQGIILVITYFGAIKDIIEIVVPIELLAQLGYALFGVHQC